MACNPSRRGLLGAAALSTLSAGAASAAASTSVDDHPTAAHHEDLVMAPMRDGVGVAASLWLPPGKGPFPVILMRSLDRRRYARRLEIIDQFLEAGYAFMGSDVRGRFESGGVFDPTYGIPEGRDGYDTIQWLASQPWCDGKVGMYGLSHQSFYQVSAALQQPPALKAIATWTGGYRLGAQRYEGAAPPMSGGVTNLATTMIWLPNEAGDALNRLQSKGEDVSEARRVLARMRTHPEETFGHLPLREAPITKYAGLRELFDYRLSTTSKPETGPGTPLEEIEVPTFHECGWFDPAAWNQIQAFSGLRDRAGTEAARQGQYMTIGPWMHAMVFSDRLGDIYFGPASENAGAGINRAQIDFFDKYLRGKTQVHLSPVRYFVMGPGVWRESPIWPPAHVRRSRLYLDGASGDRRLANGPGPADIAHYDYDPLNPAPTIGGAFEGPMTIPGMIPGPIEQSVLERRADVLVYTSEALAEDLEISGPIVACLYVSTSAVDTDFTAKLTQVLTDGRSYNLGDAILRLRGRNQTGRDELVSPGEVYKIELGLGHTSIVLNKGQRIRVQISSSNFPQYDRNMNTGNAIGVDREGPIAHQSVFHGGEHASYVELSLGKPLREPG